MIAWKVFKLRKNGTLGSLFVDGSRRLQTEKWLKAHTTFRPSWLLIRPGWHTHLNKDLAAKLLEADSRRVLVAVQLRGITAIESNGRTVSNWIRIPNGGLLS